MLKPVTEIKACSTGSSIIYNQKKTHIFFTIMLDWSLCQFPSTLIYSNVYAEAGPLLKSSAAQWKMHSSQNALHYIH